jgi:hypothetical protein
MTARDRMLARVGMGPAMDGGGSGAAPPGTGRQTARSTVWRHPAYFTGQGGAGVGGGTGRPGDGPPADGEAHCSARIPLLCRGVSIEPCSSKPHAATSLLLSRLWLAVWPTPAWFPISTRCVDVDASMPRQTRPYASRFPPPTHERSVVNPLSVLSPVSLAPQTD